MAEIIVALDVDDAEAALDLVDRVGERVRWYKVGSPLFTRGGHALIRALAKREKRVFLDLKFHDIPNTVASAVRAARELGVELLTVHAAGGSAMLRAAVEAAGNDGPAVLGVTILTSFTVHDIEETWAKELRSLRDEVGRLAQLAADAGLAGVVASPLEAELLKRRHGADFLVVTPGIRMPDAVPDDQARTATPAAAARAGADYLVVGRPVILAADPVAAVAALQADLDDLAEAVE